MHIRRVLAVAAMPLCLWASPAAAASPDAAAFDWAYPGGAVVPPPQGFDKVTAQSLAGSEAHFTEAQLHDLGNLVDWWPQRHPRPPQAVVRGRAPGINACGFCHMPSGQGRPENATLAGLPKDYIIRQMAAFAGGTRHGAQPGWLPSIKMVEVAQHALPAEIAAAAAYFSARRFVPHTRIVETATVATSRARAFTWVGDSVGSTEPLGSRIIETPVSFERFEKRDPTVEYTAFVPPGSIARGRVLARGGSGIQPCATCHGARLAGAIGPPLAGRSPSYIVRQLRAFRDGARSGPEAAPMVAVAAGMTPETMIALAAYAGALKP